MSNPLFEAIKDGKLDQVIKLLGDEPELENTYESMLSSLTPLGHAVCCGQEEIYNYLKKAGAKTQFNNLCKYYPTLHSIPVVMESHNKASASFIKQLVKDSDQLNPRIAYENKTLVEMLFEKFSPLMINFSNYIFHEAIIRGDIDTLNNCFLKPGPTGRTTINLVSLKEYLEPDTTFTASQLININAAIDVLAKRQYPPEDIKAIKEEFERRCPNKLCVELFPPEIHRELVDNSSFKELLGQLKLPNAAALKITLNQSDDFMLQLINSYTKENGTNPAAIALSKILLFKSNDKITIDNSQPILTSSEQEQGQRVINQFYSCTKMERLLLGKINKLTQTVDELKKEVNLLKQEQNQNTKTTSDSSFLSFKKA